MEKFLILISLLQYAGAGASATYNFPSVASTSPLTQAQHQAYAAAALQAAQWSSSYNPGTLASTLAIAPKVKSSWPLLFETNGASYIYQQQSGLFYDCVQRYFYCTKSKQYYNEVDGTYWIQSQPGDKNPFTQFYPPEPDGAQPIEEEQPSQEVLCCHGHQLFFCLISIFLFRKLPPLKIRNQVKGGNLLFCQ